MRHNWTSKARLAGLTLSAGLIAAAGWAAPAQAAPIDDSFLSALDGAGINLGGNPADTTALGQSVCPMLEQSAPTIAPAASGVSNAVSAITGKSGVSPEMAEMFINIAVPMYCPQMMSQLASGQVPNLFGLPGLSGGVPGL